MNSELVQTGFFEPEEVHNEDLDCYIGLSSDSIDRLEQYATDIYDIADRASIEIGHKLSKAREEYRHNKHGGFEGWVEKRLKWERTKAYRTIWRYEFATVAPAQQLENIVPYAQSLLGAPSVPQSARDEALLLAETTKINRAKAEDIIAKARKAEELEEEKQELQRSFDLFKDDRKKERQEYENKLKSIENEKDAKENEILGYKQAKAIIDDQIRFKVEEIARLKEELEKKPEQEDIEKRKKELEGRIQAKETERENLEKEQERLRIEARQRLDEDLARQREEQKVKLKELKESYTKKEQDLQLKAENTIRSLLSHGIKSMAETQLTIEHTVSAGMLQAVQQLGGKQVDSFLAQAESLQEEIDRVIAKLTHGDYLALEERISANG
jgi:hypothetical protein